MTEAKRVETVLNFEVEGNQEKESKIIKQKKIKPKEDICTE